MGLKKVSKKNLAKKTLTAGIQVPWNLCLDYLLAGHAVVTLVDVGAAKRHTYYVARAVDDEKQNDGSTKQVEKDRWFVHVLHGKDNSRAYSYIGVIDDVHGARRFRTTKGTKKAAATAENINLMGDTVKWLVDGTDASHKIKFWHRGFCARCCAALTVPASIATGFGPTCAGLLGIQMKQVAPSAIEKLAALSPVEQEHEESMVQAAKATLADPESDLSSEGTAVIKNAIKKAEAKIGKTALTEEVAAKISDNEAAAPVKHDSTAVLLETALELSKMNAAEILEWLTEHAKVEETGANDAAVKMISLESLRTPKKETA